MEVNHLIGNFEEDLRTTEMLLGECDLLQTSREAIREAFLNLYYYYNSTKFDKFFIEGKIFTLKYDDKELSFKTVYSRQTYITDNQLKEGICTYYKDGKLIDRYRFKHEYL